MEKKRGVGREINHLEFLNNGNKNQFQTADKKRKETNKE